MEVFKLAESPAQDGRPVRVMVVDDSRTIRSTAEALLGKEGYTVVTAEDGFDALAKIAADPPDIVFIDIMMPRLDGYQACTLIKSNPRFKGIPVVLLSSRDGVFDRARGKLAGSEQYLGKPFSREELVDVVKRHVGQASGSS